VPKTVKEKYKIAKEMILDHKPSSKCTEEYRRQGKLISFAVLALKDNFLRG